MSGKFVAGRIGHRRNDWIRMAGLSLAVAAAIGIGGLHAAPIMETEAARVAQAGAGGDDPGMTGSQSGPHSSGPASGENEEGQSQRSMPRVQSPGGSSNPADAQSASSNRRSGNDTEGAVSGGENGDASGGASGDASGASNSANQRGVDSDKRPGHRGSDTKPGH